MNPELLKDGVLGLAVVAYVFKESWQYFKKNGNGHVSKDGVRKIISEQAKVVCNPKLDDLKIGQDKIADKLDKLPCMDHGERISHLEGRVNNGVR